MKTFSNAVNYLKAHELFTLEDLDTALQGVNEKVRSINADMKKASARMKVITGIQSAVADCQTRKDPYHAASTARSASLGKLGRAQDWMPCKQSMTS